MPTPHVNDDDPQDHVPPDESSPGTDPVDLDFSTLYDRTWVEVYARCKSRLHDPDATDDALQNVYTELWRLLCGRTMTLAAGRDLLRILVRQEIEVARKQWKRSGKRSQSLASVDEQVDPHPSQLYITMAAENHVLIRKALDNLPDSLREPLELHYLHGWTHQQIASKLGLERSCVTHRLKVGLREIARVFGCR